MRAVLVLLIFAFFSSCATTNEPVEHYKSILLLDRDFDGGKRVVREALLKQGWFVSGSNKGSIELIERDNINKKRNRGQDYVTIQFARRGEDTMATVKVVEDGHDVTKRNRDKVVDIVDKIRERQIVRRDTQDVWIEVLDARVPDAYQVEAER